MEVVAWALWEMFCVIGPPKIVQSDNGTEFVNQVIEALMIHEGIHHRFVTAYHPEGNAKVESTNRTVSLVIVKMMAGDTEFWEMYVPLTQLIYNTKIREVTMTSPFSMMLNRRSNPLIDYTGTRIEPVTMENWRRHQEEVLALVFPSLEEKQLKVSAKVRKHFDETRQKLLTADLPKGMTVYLREAKYIKGAPRPREAQRNSGPWTIVGRTMHGPYRLRDPVSGEECKVPIDQIIFTRTEIKAGEPADGDKDVYVVKEIWGDRYNKRKRRYEYHIWWKGYPQEESTWEPLEHIHNTDMIRKYNAKKKTAKVRSLVLSYAGLPHVVDLSDHTEYSDTE